MGVGGCAEGEGEEKGEGEGEGVNKVVALRTCE